MIRPLIIVVNLIIVMIFKLFVGNPSAEVKAPSSVKAGEAFLVEVNISTNGETDFMRYSMDFPAGWTVEKVEAAGASYKFDKQTVKFLWSRVGEQKELNISFKVTPPADASGDFTFNNKLSHTVDNLPANIELTPMKVTVVSGGTTSPVAKIDSTAKPIVIIDIERSVPSEEVTNVFVVNLVINKEDLTSFGKIEDTLPAGFTAKMVKADGADFKFENGVVKFSWFVLPAKHTLNIQYRVTVDPDVQGNQIINGHFSYVENETGKIYTIVPSTVKVKAKEVIPVVTKEPDPVVTKEPDPVVTKEPDPVVTKQPDPVVTKEPDPVVTKEPDPVVTKEPDPVVTKTVTDPTSNPSTGVSYSVQIAAMTRMVPTSYYKNTFHLSGTINTEQIGGLNKYTTGSFTTYQNAHDSREEIRGKGVSDAFVTAYNSGKRITVQEALMITSQKWVQ